jgi:iron complex outermembrane receptor protein
MTKISAFRAMMVAGVALAGIPMHAYAQAAPEEEAKPADEGMVVIGQRQQYRGDVPLREVPQSVQVLDGKLLGDLNITRLDNALELASGISRQNNFGGLWDAFAVRGFAGDENFPSGFLVNGFNGGRGYGGPRDASNIDRIEVLKGPNGAVFGRGEPGGTVNIITKKARTDESFGSFSASGGSFNTYRVEGDYNLAISDRIAVRVNGASQQADSFRDTIHSQKYVLSPSFLVKLADKTSLTYEMEYVNQQVPFDRGVVAVNGKLGVIPNSRFLGEPGDGPTNVKVFGHQVQLQQGLGKDWVLLAGFGYRSTIFRGYSSDAELALGRQTLDNDGINLARQRRFRDYDTNNISARAELSGKIYTGPFTHHVLIGGDWDRFNIDSVQLRYRPPAYVAGTPVTARYNAINIFNPVYGSLPTPNSTVTNSYERQQSYGFYAQDQIDLTDSLKLRIGGRYDHFQQTLVDRSVSPSTVTRVLRERFSPTAGLLYKVTDLLSVYGGYGKGFRPNSGSGRPINGVRSPFEPELSESYEVGLRFAAPDDVVSGTIAAFTMKKNNILTQDPVDGNFSVAIGSARSKGIEADFNAKLPSEINVIATYAYTDSYWTSSSKDPNFGAFIQPGDRLINIPRHAANLLVTKGFAIGEKHLTIGGGLNYVGKRLGETATQFYLPGYVVARAMATYEFSEQAKLGVDVTNLFDKTYYASSYSQLWIAPGAPRAFTVRATFSF